MSNPIKCHCGQAVTLLTQTCPNCGKNSPGLPAWLKPAIGGLVGFIVVVLLFSGGSETNTQDNTMQSTADPVAEQAAADYRAKQAANIAAAPVVNDTNIGAVMAQLQTDYQQLVTSLLTQYKLAVETGNTTGFINWRKQQWLPEKTAISDKYDSIVEKNRPWFGLKDETRATSVINNLELVSLDLLYSLQRNDKTKLKAARDKIVEMNQLLASVQTAAQ